MRIAAVFCLILGVPSLTRADGPRTGHCDAFHVISTHETVANGLRRITTTVQNGDLPINRFVVERVLPTRRPTESLRPIILSPALLLNQKSYTLGLEPGGGDFEHSIAANLARGGADVFLYSTRQALLTPGSCEQGTDCSEAKGWGLQARLDDFVFIRRQIAAEHGAVRPVVGGLSLGGGTALAAVNQDPKAYAGLLIMEYTAAVREAWQPGYQVLCGAFGQQLDAGLLFDTSLVMTARGLLSLSQNDPNGQANGFPPGVTNRQAYLIFAGAQSPGPPASIFFPGVVLIPTSVEENRFLNSSETLIASQFDNGNYYTPIAEFRDFTCSMGGDTTFSSNLGSFTGPVLAFAAEHGVGAETQIGLDLLGSRKITVITEPGLGHTDLIGVADHATRVEKPILDWLDKLRD